MYTQVCADGAFDVSSQTCGSFVWVEMPTVLPPLSVNDAAAIGQAILVCWCIGYAFKVARKVVASYL